MSFSSSSALPCLLLIACGINVVTAAKLVKVFILAGQSNMTGRGSIEHLDKLVKSPGEYRDALWDESTATYKERDDVYIKCSHGQAHGKLTVSDDSGYSMKGRFGPELAFGITIADSKLVGDDETPILIIKAAWGSTSLAVDWRPPSSGLGDYGVPDEDMYGHYYHLMIMDVLDTLKHLPTYVPGHTDYELAGFVWFQGFNDAVKKQAVNEYGSNLLNLIEDVRKDLGAPDLPFVVGGLGMHGFNVTGSGADRVHAMRKAQKEVTLKAAKTSYVPTHWHAVLDTTETYDLTYHYNGRADTVFHIGEHFGKAMLELLD